MEFCLFVEFRNARGRLTFNRHDILLGDYLEEQTSQAGKMNFELYHKELLSIAWRPHTKESSDTSDTKGSIYVRVGLLSYGMG